jgi:type IV pilus assembly protein PilM
MGQRAERWLRQDLPRWLQRVFVDPPMPPVCIEMDPTRLILAVARRDRQNGRPLVSQLRQQALPEGILEPSPLKPNIANPDALASEVRRLFAGLTPPENISLLLPDGVAKVGLVELASLPRSHQDALELVRFRLKKTVPFRIDDAIMGFEKLDEERGRVRLLTTIAYRPVIAQYQEIIERLGARVGMVSLSTLALLGQYGPILSAAGSGVDVLLANVMPRALSLAVVRDGRLLLFRSKTLPAEGGKEERRQTARREWQTTLAYYEEKLSGRGFTRALARLVDWNAADLLDAEDARRLELIRAHDWGAPAPELGTPPSDSATFAPALSLALWGAS